MQNKPIVVISSPVDTYSGYGARSRDFIKALIEVKPQWDIKLLSQRWGNTDFGYLMDHNEIDLISRIIPGLDQAPDGWIQISIPSEFQKVGKYFSWGVTAGIETTACHSTWLEGLNKMDLNIVSSQFSKTVLSETVYNQIEESTKRVVNSISSNKPMEVLFEGIDLDKYFKIDFNSSLKGEIVDSLDEIKEDFCFLFVGHWLRGSIGEDRKNVGLMIKIFMEAFKNKMNKPALILKTSTSKDSIMDKYRVMKNIDDIAKSVNSKNLPNIYVLQGDLHDDDMNLLYNHKKVKSMISFTKGEGYGRPLSEFAVTGKPLIVSGYSGHLDFLRPNYNKFIDGELTPVHESALVENIIIKDSKWFSIDNQAAFNSLRDMYDNYKSYHKNSKDQSSYIANNFSYDKMKEKLSEYVDKYANIPEEKIITLPTLKKI